MSFLIRPTSKGFRVIEETYTPKKAVKTVPVAAYAALGFRQDMTLEQAKARAKQINQQRSRETLTIVGAAERAVDDDQKKAIYLPAQEVALFEEELRDQYEFNPYRLEINMRYWKAAQECILKVGIDPKDFKPRFRKLYNLFVQNKWSQDYIKRIVRILDLWGYCVARHRGSAYEKIPKLSSDHVRIIHESREDARGIRRACAPLRWNDLKAKKDTFESEGLIELWNWLFIATWFGLRPPEVDGLKDTKTWEVVYDPEMKVDILWVYQSKLVRLEKDLRWKPIPLYFQEQKDALKLIQAKAFRRPLGKTLKRIFNERIQAASPRKAFTDHMRERNFELVDISTFLGHQRPPKEDQSSLKMTWTHYKDRQRFKAPKIG